MNANCVWCDSSMAGLCNDPDQCPCSCHLDGADLEGFCCYFQRNLRDGLNHHPNCTNGIEEEKR